ncbi:MAG: type II secretion system protein [Chloroflexi bacterium]|nr:MAG: type II secretion system protein [Chloroflexota bacterium]
MTHNKRIFMDGFTIVELLIVIVVIGILATITIVSFNGIQVRAKNAAWVSEFKGYQKLFMLYQAQYGKYPTMPINNRYCLGDKNIKAADVNAAFSAPDADPNATPISAPFNDGGYCRDVYYPSSRHEASPALMTELDKVGRVNSKQKTSADFPTSRFGSIGVIVSYQAYTSDPESGIWLGVMLNDKGGNCPADINGRKYDYDSDTVYCEIRLPEAPF